MFLKEFPAPGGPRFRKTRLTHSQKCHWTDDTQMASGMMIRDGGTGARNAAEANLEGIMGGLTQSGKARAEGRQSCSQGPEKAPVPGDSCWLQRVLRGTCEVILPRDSGEGVKACSISRRVFVKGGSGSHGGTPKACGDARVTASALLWNGAGCAPHPLAGGLTRVPESGHGQPHQAHFM